MDPHPSLAPLGLPARAAGAGAQGAWGGGGRTAGALLGGRPGWDQLWEDGWTSMSLAAPRRLHRPWGGGSRVFTFGRRTAVGRERPRPGQHRSGADMPQGRGQGQGRGREGWPGRPVGSRVPRGMGPGQRRPPPAPGRACRPGEGPWGAVPSPAQWEVRAPSLLQPRPGRISFSEAAGSLDDRAAPWASAGGGWLWVRGLSWCRAGTAAEARGARPPPAPGSRRGPPAARPCAWPAPSG